MKTWGGKKCSREDCWWWGLQLQVLERFQDAGIYAKNSNVVDFLQYSFAIAKDGYCLCGAELVEDKRGESMSDTERITALEKKIAMKEGFIKNLERAIQILSNYAH